MFLSGRYRFIETPEASSTYYVALELSNPQPVDGATYRLNARNAVGESNANLKLNFDGQYTEIFMFYFYVFNLLSAVIGPSLDVSI